MYNSRFFCRTISYFLFINMFTSIHSCEKGNGEQSNLPDLGTCRLVDASLGLQPFGNRIYEYHSPGGVTVKIQRTTDLLTVTMKDVSYPVLQYLYRRYRA